MNKKLMRIISAVMAICLLACMIVPAASAMRLAVPKISSAS